MEMALGKVKKGIANFIYKDINLPKSQIYGRNKV
jgi:hypothetical protein